MKKLILLICIFVLLIAATGAVSADNPAPNSFTISGYTNSYDYKIVSNGRNTKFDLLAEGASTGDLQGPFTFEEWGSVDFNPETYQGSGNGTNNGMLTITNGNDSNSQVVIWFGGKSTLYTVAGTWKVVSGKGAWRDLEGRGEYTGDAGMVFSVTFTGEFND